MRFRVTHDHMHTSPPLDYITHPYKYYIHYIEWDRRMDEWTGKERLYMERYVCDVVRRESEERQKKG